MSQKPHVVLNSVTAYNFIHHLHFWDGLLNHINRVKLRLQDPKMNFHELSKDIKVLGECLQIMREDLTSEAASQGKVVAEILGFPLDVKSLLELSTPIEV